MGRQELYAELLEDVPGALWTGECIEANRLVAAPCDVQRIVVAIDPAATSGEGANETGIIIAGEGADGNGYVLRDLSARMAPAVWGEMAVRGYREYKADRIVGESNNGGEMIERVLRTVDPNIPYRAVHASRGKSHAPSRSRRSTRKAA